LGDAAKQQPQATRATTTANGCDSWPPSSIQAKNSPKLAHFSYETGLSPNATRMPAPTYRFVSERELGLASQDKGGMVVFGVQAGEGTTVSNDLLVAMRVDPATKEVTVVQETTIPVVPTPN